MSYQSQQPDILQLMISYMQNPSNWPDGIPKVTDFTLGSVAFTFLAAVAVGIDTNALAIYLARQAAYISTATGTDLDNKAADYGVTRKPAVAAYDQFTFTKVTPSTGPTLIPGGASISTVPSSTSPLITYKTNADVSLPAGQVSVNASVTCQVAGAVGNLAANTKLLIGSAVVGIDGVQLTTNITTGVDIESDDLLRARTLGAFASLARGTASWYKQTALGVPGIQSATVIPQNRGAGTVDVFIVGPNNTIPSSTLQAQVQAAIDAGRPCTDDGKEQTPTPLTVNTTIQIHLLAGYDPVATCAAAQTAASNYINNLGVGAGNIGHIYAAQLIIAAMSVPGVVNATTTFSDTAVTVYQLPQAGTITVTTF